MPTIIRTSKLGATDTVGTRIRATCEGRQLTTPYDYAARDPHAVAARALADKLGLDSDARPIIVGQLRTGYTFRIDAR